MSQKMSDFANWTLNVLYLHSIHCHFYSSSSVNCFKTVSDFCSFSFFFLDWKFSDSLLIYIHCLLFAAATQVLKIKKCLLCKSQFDNDEKLKSYNYNFHNVDGENYFFKRQFEKKARCKFSPRLWLLFFKRQNLRNCMIFLNTILKEKCQRWRQSNKYWQVRQYQNLYCFFCRP